MVTLHGLTLDSADARDLTRAAVVFTVAAVDEAVTLTEYVDVAEFAGSALRDALALGIPMVELCRWTGHSSLSLADLLTIEID